MIHSLASLLTGFLNSLKAKVMLNLFQGTILFGEAEDVRNVGTLIKNMVLLSVIVSALNMKRAMLDADQSHSLRF